MESLDVLFSAILRFSLIGFVLLSACLWGIQFLRQPLERIRLIEISLLAIAVSLVVGTCGLVPAIDLAWLPAADPADGLAGSLEVSDPATDQHRHRQESGLRSMAPAEPDVTSLDQSASVERDSPSELTRPVTSAHRANSFVLSQVLARTLAVVFLIVSFLNLAYLMVGILATRRLVRRARPLTAATQVRVQRIVDDFPAQRRVKFVSSDSIRVPMVAGFWRPTILLPERLTASDSDSLELQHSIAHEWGHVVQHDLISWQLASFCQTVLWLQPCYWILRRELRIAQDQLADQFAIEQTHEHASYATTLLGLSRAHQRLLPGALTMAGGGSNLFRRIEMLMNEKFRMARVTRKSIAISLCVLFVSAGVLLTSLKVTHAAIPETETVKGQAGVGTAQSAGVNGSDKRKSVKHSGVVRDADTGEPIAGVSVTVTRMESRNWQELGVTESVTDQDGRYTFSIPPEQLSQRALYIMFDIDHPEFARRHCGSYGYGMIASNLKNGEQPWFSEFKMVRGEKLFGRLIDENQQPVAGVQIRCQSAASSGYDRVRMSTIRGMSDEDGRFELVVTHDGITKLSFIPPEHCMKYVRVGENRGDLGDITLSTGFPMHGVVTDATGNPMEGLWVNITSEEERREASYEMKRSTRTERDGSFSSRPLDPGRYLIEVGTKATGALEKRRYANFDQTPPPAMFVTRSINVTEDSARQPVLIQAVPHVLITVQHYAPNGEISNGHSPSVTGKFDGQRMWLRSGRKTGKGAYELMAPHGFKDAELRFTTNEHSGLMVQFDGGELSPQQSYRFDSLEEDIENVRVVRHPAGILKLDIVDESGSRIEKAGIFAHYEFDENPGDQMMMAAQIGWNRDDGLFRLSSIVPEWPVSVRFDAAGFVSETKKFTLKEGERRSVTVSLSHKADQNPDSSD